MLNKLNNYNSIVEKFIKGRIEVLQAQPDIPITNFMDFYLQEYIK